MIMIMIGTASIYIYIYTCSSVYIYIYCWSLPQSEQIPSLMLGPDMACGQLDPFLFAVIVGP